MPQSSAPLVGVNLSDSDWRDLFGEEAGVVADFDGSAYKLTTSTDDTVLQVGSTTQRSVARVGGFVHRIPMGQTEPVSVPPTTGSNRTDIIALRYDPTYAGAPGPVRLVVLTGTSAGAPAYDDSPPGVEELPLWAVLRKPGETLSAATKTQLYTRLAPALDLPAGASLPVNSPLGTMARKGATTYRRGLDSGGLPAWLQDQYVQATAPASAPDGAIWFQA